MAMAEDPENLDQLVEFEVRKHGIVEKNLLSYTSYAALSAV